MGALCWSRQTGKGSSRQIWSTQPSCSPASSLSCPSGPATICAQCKYLAFTCTCATSFVLLSSCALSLIPSATKEPQASLGLCGCTQPQHDCRRQSPRPYPDIAHGSANPPLSHQLTREVEQLQLPLLFHGHNVPPVRECSLWSAAIMREYSTA